MTVYSFWMFDRHTECVFHREWNKVGGSSSAKGEEDTAKLIFGIVFSLRNMVQKLSNGNFLSYKTSRYKLHYFESPSNLKLVLITDPYMESIPTVLQQIYANLYIEYVVKNPLSPIEHAGGAGVDNEMFSIGLDSFVRSLPGFA